MSIKNKYFLLILTLLIIAQLFSECRSNTENKNAKTDTIPKIDLITKTDTIMEYPKVTKTFETFDFERYEKRPPADEDGYREPTYVQHLQNGIVYEMYRDKDDAYCQIYYPESPFMITKQYYPNGNIKEKGLDYVKGFSKGVWYEFNESGKLIKETDYDKPYPFTFEDVIKFCENNGIKIAKGYQSDISTTIYRENSGDSCYWEIRYTEKKPKNSLTDNIETTIKLDGETGRIISRTEKPFAITI